MAFEETESASYYKHYTQFLIRSRILREKAGVEWLGNMIRPGQRKLLGARR